MNHSSDQAFTGFSEETFAFFRQIGENNRRDWFEAHREEYARFVLAPLRALASEVAGFLAGIDLSMELRADRAVSRLHRDTRFSHDKSPFRDHMWITFRQRDRPMGEVPGFFFEMYAQAYRYGMGFYSASRAAMDRFRSGIDRDPGGFLRLVAPLEQEGRFEVMGPFYKKSLGLHHPPDVRRWYDRKTFYLQRRRPREPVLFSPKLVDELVEGFARLAPLYLFLRSRAEAYRRLEAPADQASPPPASTLVQELLDAGKPAHR